MHSILLDEKQSSVLTRNHDPVQVRNQSGILVGHIVPHGKTQYHTDGWVESWNEWYLDIEELEAEEIAGKTPVMN